MKRIALISNDKDLCKVMNFILPLDFDSTAESFLSSQDRNFDVLLIDINAMDEHCLRELLKHDADRRIIRIISSVPFIYLPKKHKSLLNEYQDEFNVKPFNLYSFKEKLLVEN